MSIEAKIAGSLDSKPVFAFPAGDEDTASSASSESRSRRSLSSPPDRAEIAPGSRLPGSASGPAFAALCRAGVHDVLVLTKVNISMLSMASAAAGYFLAAGGVGYGILVALAGTFVLACGSAAMNEVQEWRYDALMDRTKKRPIPSGRLSPLAGFFIAAGLVAAGTWILFAGVGRAAGLLGLGALVSYNLVYTPLKRVTAFAVIPGSIIGAIPPAIGWVAAGGRLADPRILALSFFFFIWQVPHFWLLLLKYGKDYERAGFPVLTRIFSIPQLARLTFVWILATAGAAVLLPLFHALTSGVLIVLLFSACLWLCWKTKVLLGVRGGGFSPWPAFMQINLFALAVMALVSAEGFLR
jgi:protoheme IX farnesyltransferase